MMLESGYGSILSSELIGEYYREYREEYLKTAVIKELENLRDQITTEYYHRIVLIRVNEKYKIQALVEEALKTLLLLDDTSFAEKVNAVEAGPLANNALMEVTIPLCRGYMDWDTVMAIRRINHDLRPYKFRMQRTIDRDFLEALVEEYTSKSLPGSA
jgi:hypothetical protein